jgi:hypothetical protein
MLIHLPYTQPLPLFPEFMTLTFTEKNCQDALHRMLYGQRFLSVEWRVAFDFAT